MTIRAEGNKTEISFLNPEGEAAACGGGRVKRIGRVSGRIESLLVLVDSSIVEVFVNGGELVFTSRIYLEKPDRKLQIQGGGSSSLAVIKKA